MEVQRVVFTVAVTIISRTLVFRDRLLGRLRRVSTAAAAGVKASRHVIPCATDHLDGVLVMPAEAPQAALLVCHGIGEIVDHWRSAQDLLAEHGIASLVFDYRGYGKSSGAVDWSQCEEDAVAAFFFLEALVPGVPVSILGFSMGSGVATAILDRIRAVQLILSSAFTTFRDAACVLGLPRRFCSLLPRIWCNTELLCRSPIPVLIVHGQADRAFPVRMASELSSVCGSQAELIVVPEQTHNQAYYRPQMSYWSHIVGRLVPRSRACEDEAQASRAGGPKGTRVTLSAGGSAQQDG
jgi:uncharacterized protein